MPRFKVWCQENRDEEDAEVFTSYSPEAAIERWASRDHSRNDYWAEQTVSVRCDDGPVQQWTVVAEQEVVFRSRPCRLS